MYKGFYSTYFLWKFYGLFSGNSDFLGLSWNESSGLNPDNSVLKFRFERFWSAFLMKSLSISSSYSSLFLISTLLLKVSGRDSGFTLNSSCSKTYLHPSLLFMSTTKTSLINLLASGLGLTPLYSSFFKSLVLMISVIISALVFDLNGH